MANRTYSQGRTIVGGIPRGADLLLRLNEICLGEKVRTGTIKAVGAVEKARVAYYDQRRKLYTHYELDGGLEILSLSGNVSIKEGIPFVHAHAVFCDSSGQTSGGHLAEGTVVFTCEFVITELIGDELVRSHDEDTGLTIWKIQP